MACSMSCVARALPANSLWMYPPRISRLTCSPLPVCTIAGPPTSSDWPVPRRSNSSRAMPRMATPLGFSVETLLDMNSNAWCCERSLLGKHAHAGVAHDELRAQRHVAHGHAVGPALTVDGDAAIHFLVGNFNPAAVDADFGALVGRAVESFGKRAGNIGRHQMAVLLRGGDGAMIADLRENGGEDFGGGRADVDQGEAGIALGFADRDLLDLEGAAGGVDQVEHLGKDQAVDDVPGNLHFLDEGGAAGSAGRKLWAGLRGRHG